MDLNEIIDLEKLIELFDTALTSDNPSVKNALQSLLTITVLSTVKDPDAVVRTGPLREMYKSIIDINKRLRKLEEKELYDQAAKNTAEDIAKYSRMWGQGVTPKDAWEIIDKLDKRRKSE